MKVRSLLTVTTLLASMSLYAQVRPCENGPSNNCVSEISCSLTITEEIPVLRLKVNRSDIPRVGNNRFDIKPEDIISKEELNPQFFNGKYSEYDALKGINDYFLLTTPYSHKSLNFQIINKFSPANSDGEQYLAIKTEDQLGEEGYMIQLKSVDSSLENDYNVSEIDMILFGFAQLRPDGKINLSVGFRVSDWLKVEEEGIDIKSAFISSNHVLNLNSPVFEAQTVMQAPSTTSTYIVSENQETGPRSYNLQLKCK